MILVIDNYDSFVYNLARHMALTGWKYEVVRNDALSLADIEDMKPEAIVLSPGPCTPQEAGISVETVKTFGAQIPILGVCLGHQCIGEAYGAKTMRGAKPVHGKASDIFHEGTDLFEGLPSPMQGGRYHSLVIEPGAQSPLRVTARTSAGEIMAVRHNAFPVYGVQFHPESVLTQHGLALIKNFTALALRWHEDRCKAA
jgi:anthranilate synthase/aminodeoxychorismate synthase-like glutamine amidotransferase